MAAEYEFYKNPVGKDQKKVTRLHARVVPYGTKSIRDLAESIERAHSITRADVEAVLSVLGTTFVSYLQNGYRIHIDGLGYFRMNLQCPSIKYPNEIRAESIHFKSISFTPEIEVKKELSLTKFQRTERKFHSLTVDPKEIDGLLAVYFAEHTYITCKIFQRLCHQTRSTAYRYFNQLIADGRLVRMEGLRAYRLAGEE